MGIKERSGKKDSKTRHLLLGLLFDALGMVSFTIPYVGEFADVVWAPVSAWLMIKMYKGRSGQVAGAISFIEEIIPGLDFIPSFTLMWLYTYLFKGAGKGPVIDPKSPDA